MKIGQRIYGGASCVLRFVDGLPEEMKHEVRMITELYTRPESRKQGHAKELLTRLFEEADKKKVILLLTPAQFDPHGLDSPDDMTTAQLTEWYAALGFNEIQKEPVLMARMFNIPQVLNAAEAITNIISEGSK